jgi:hypothetical protein
MEKTTHKNTHLQTAQCQLATQSLQESIFFSTQQLLKTNNLPSLKKIKLIFLIIKYISTTKKKH